MKRQSQSLDRHEAAIIDIVPIRSLVNREHASDFATRKGISHLQACRLLARYGSDPNKLEAALQRLKDDR
ncbi:MAG: hypothetical protein JO124_01455 [Hyphomicrobiales bacterium]|nr:hypothetical protein [Hyphomicrobiales bacterium]MBV9978346.1 hypothetical protein [Hyphomicrobiales bacterium]